MHLPVSSSVCTILKESHSSYQQWLICAALLMLELENGYINVGIVFLFFFLVAPLKSRRTKAFSSHPNESHC